MRGRNLPCASRVTADRVLIAPMRGRNRRPSMWTGTGRRPHRPYEGSQRICGTCSNRSASRVLIAPMRGRNTTFNLLMAQQYASSSPL